MIRHGFVWVIDLVLIGGLLLSVLGVVGYAQPLVIAPLDGLVTNESDVVFSFERGQRVLVDDNLEFSSPEIYEVEEGGVITLDPGRWYWRVEGAKVSKVRSLTIQGIVALEIRSDGEGYDVVNVGNTRLLVEVYDGTEKVDELRVASGESRAATEGLFIGGQDE